jgi:hypothetical protein
VAIRGTAPPDAAAAPPEAQESLGSRKTVAEVPLTGLSFHVPRRQDVMLSFVAVPESSTYAMALAAIACGG